jgi:hypothetical protein
MRRQIRVIGASHAIWMGEGSKEFLADHSCSRVVKEDFEESDSLKNDGDNADSHSRARDVQLRVNQWRRVTLPADFPLLMVRHILVVTRLGKKSVLLEANGGLASGTNQTGEVS